MQTTRSHQEISLQSKPYTIEDWRGGNRSLKQEFAYPIKDVEGEIPTNLNGTLFRNGPGLLDVFGRRLHHPFDGDGMVCAISFSNGRAYFRNRFVRTEAYCAEGLAGRMLYRGVFGTQKPGGWLANAFDLRKKNVANTNVIYWGEKLLALWEASHPYRLDPKTLHTFGIETLDGVLHKNSPFAAHPKIDPGDENREPRLVNFAIKPGPLTTISVYELDLTGKVVQQHDHKIPGFAFIHDFAITPQYCLFFQNPLSFNPLPYILGFRGAAECIKFERDRPTKIWIIPRNPTQEAQVIDTDPCFVFHHANAFEQGNEIIVDSICYESFLAIDHNLNYEEIDFDSRPPGQLWRFHLNLQTSTSHRHLIHQRANEFPFINPASIGKPYHCVYLAAAHQLESDAPQQAIIKVDPEFGEQQFWSAAPKGFVGEPVFVPCTPTKGAEDDGWVLTLVYDATSHCSDVVILDGKNLEKGAIARLHLKHHIPYGLHGSFTSEV
ncbi:carotenoid oxygenase family protein [Fischerella sp. JS2]|uniref:carotenoid oxygenase family protein n=1 Tax=Fischerella sp. JS2 TaxID=2597771 RepID=UPI0028E5E127|nr:carotenoid oxygenase family protein [Fischerella sp. JS2]